MTTMILDAPETRARRRPGVRTPARPAVKKTKVTLVLDDDAAKRLAVYAALTEQERSAVVGQLIREHLRRFRVQDLDRTDPRDTGEGRQDVAAA
jgi:hypothetical protein